MNLLSLEVCNDAQTQSEGCSHFIIITLAMPFIELLMTVPWPLRLAGPPKAEHSQSLSSIMTLQCCFHAFQSGGEHLDANATNASPAGMR